MSRCGGMVDTANLKFVERKLVWVQVPPSALQAFVVELVDTPVLGTGSSEVQVRCLSRVQCSCGGIVDTTDLKSDLNWWEFESPREYI